MPRFKETLRCRVGSVVTPQIFWVAPSSVSEEIIDYRHRLCEAAKLSPTIKTPLRRAQYVLVHNSAHRCWDRAVVRKVISDKKDEIIHQVFLVDRGSYVKTKQLRLVSKALFREHPYYAFQVGLYGIVPAGKSLKWSSKARQRLQEVLSSKEVEITLYDFFVEDIHFGSMEYFEDGAKHQVAQLLRMLGYARENELEFLNGVNELCGIGDLNSTSAASARSEDFNSSKSDVSYASNVISYVPENYDYSVLTTKNCTSSLTEKSYTSVFTEDDDASDSDESFHSAIASTCGDDENNDNENQSINLSGIEAEHSSVSYQFGLESDEQILNSEKAPENFRLKEIANLSPKGDAKDVKGCRGSTDFGISEVGSGVASMNGISNKHIQDDNETEEFSGVQCIKGSACERLKRVDISQIPEGYKWYPDEKPMSLYGTVLVRCDEGDVCPILNLRDVPFDQQIHLKILDSGVKRLFPIQNYSIPAIMRGLNTIMISSPKSGKTRSITLPVMNFLLKHAQKGQATDGNGPLIIILCSSSESCEFVARILCAPLAKFQYKNLNYNIRIVTAYGGTSQDINKKIELTNGCELLVTTPHSLVRLLREHLVTNLERLRCFVIDEVDVLVEDPFITEIKILVSKLMDMSKKKSIQWILSGRRLTTSVWKLLNTIKSYSLLISSHYEAAIYSQLKPRLIYASGNRKIETTLDLLSPVIGRRKIVVMCPMMNQLIKLRNVLKAAGHAPIEAHSQMSLFHLKRVRSAWNEDSTSFLICLDDVLSELHIDDATFLLQFGIPSSKTEFGFRFSTISSHYRDHFHRKPQSPHEPICVILLDETDSRPLPTIIQFAERVGLSFDEKVVKECREIETRKELESTKPICQCFLATGSCRKAHIDCENRHMIFPKDVSDFPLGEITFILSCIIDAASYGVRITSFTDSSGVVQQIPSDYIKIKLELERHYKIKDNRLMCGNPKVGNLCAVSNSENLFFRAKVLKIIKLKTENRSNKIATLRLIDQGDLVKKDINSLWYLPEHLAEYPPQAVIIYVAGIAPGDFDTTWSFQSKSVLLMAWERDIKEHETWRGKVVLALKDALIVERPMLMSFLPSVKTTIVELDIVKELLQTQLAAPNPNHLPLLQSHLKLPEKTLSEGPVLVKSTVEPQWAHFSDEYVDVVFTFAAGTDLICFNQRKFTDLLGDVEKQCAVEAAKLKPKTPFVFEIGMYCMIRSDQADKWNRAHVKNIDSDCDHAEVLCVDYGDSQNVSLQEMVPLPDKLISILPFQAIECRLFGMQHQTPCSEEVLDVIYSFCDESSAPYLQVRNSPLEVVGSITNGPVYTIDLSNKMDENLNELLLEKNLAELDIEQQLASALNVMEDDVNGSFENLSTLCRNMLNIDIGNTAKSQTATITELPDKTEATPQTETVEDDKKNVILDVVMSEDEDRSSVCSSDKKIDEGSEEQNNKLSHTKEIKSHKVDDVLQTQEIELHVVDEVPRGKELEYVLAKPEGTLTPKVLWHQNEARIWLKVQVMNAKYHIFRCFYYSLKLELMDIDGKRYLLSLPLYSAVCPTMCEFRIKTFHVELILRKVGQFYWPALLNHEERRRNIIYDAETVVRPIDDDSDDDGSLDGKNENLHSSEIGRRAEEDADELDDLAGYVSDESDS